MKILIIDDHALFRAGLVLLLRAINPSVTCLDHGSYAAAQPDVAGLDRDSVIFLDLYMPAGNGLDVLLQLKEIAPETPVIVLSGDDRTEVVREVLERGASGFLSKASDPDRLDQALREVMAGKVHIPAEILKGGMFPESRPLALGNPIPMLTSRQRDVLDCLLRGMSNKAICRALDLSDATARQHTQAVMRALNVQTRAQVVIQAVKLGVGMSSTAPVTSD